MSNALTDAIFAGITSQRPEFKNAVKTWADTLEPALAVREAERKATISKARNRTITTALIVGAFALIFLYATRGNAAVFTLIAGAAITAIASGASWIPLFAMKSETKQLVVGSAAEAFGFKYPCIPMSMA